MKRIVCEYGALGSSRCRRSAVATIKSDVWMGGTPRCEEHLQNMADLLAKNGHKQVTITTLASPERRPLTLKAAAVEVIREYGETGLVYDSIDGLIDAVKRERQQQLARVRTHRGLDPETGEARDA
jgi:hypothetical protein